MIASSQSQKRDIEAQTTLLALIIITILLMTGFDEILLIVPVTLGFFLVFLYIQRVRLVPIHIRTPVSDVFIALSGLVSTLHLLGKSELFEFENIFSQFTPITAIGLLIFGLFSKLFLLEELFKELIRITDNLIRVPFRWMMKSRKNVIRGFLVISSLLLITSSRFIFEDLSQEYSLTLGLVSLSCIFLLDFNEIETFGRKRRLIMSGLSIIILTNLYRVAGDYENIGNYTLSLSLLGTSIKWRSTFNRVLEIIFSVKVWLISSYHAIIQWLVSIYHYVQNNSLKVFRGSSFILGIIFFFIPSSSTINLGFNQIEINFVIGSILIIVGVGPLAYRTLKSYLINLVILIQSLVISVFNWFQRFLKSSIRWVTIHYIGIIRTILSIISLIVMFLGPNQFYLNIILGVGILAFAHFALVKSILNRIKDRVNSIITFILRDISMIYGYMGLGLFIAAIVNRQNPLISVILTIIGSLFLLSGWNYFIIRIFDYLTNPLVFLFSSLVSLITKTIQVLSRLLKVRRLISISSWILLVLAIFDVLDFPRLILVISWIIIWHLAYPHRILQTKTRIIHFLTYLKNTTIFFIRSLIDFAINGLNLLFRAVEKILYTIYAYFIIIILWAIALFFIVLSIDLILPIDISLTQDIFGDSVDDTLVSLIIGVTLFGAAVLSIQQTYVRRAKLLIGGNSK